MEDTQVALDHIHVEEAYRIGRMGVLYWRYRRRHPDATEEQLGEVWWLLTRSSKWWTKLQERKVLEGG